MKSTQQLIGQRFGRAVVLEYAGKDKRRNVLWLCKCDCGKEFVTRGSNLLDGSTASCGCLANDIHKKQALKMGQANVTHGLSRTPTWVSWSMLMQRCFNPKRKDYKDWGGRGIKPCLYIAESPANVIALIGERPEGMTIDKIDNDGGYTCGKCPECVANGWPMNIQWLTLKDQQHKKRNLVWITKDGLTMLRHEWAKHLGKSIAWVRKYMKQYEQPKN